jgi:hypothetical protein
MVSLVENESMSAHQFLRYRGKTRSPPLNDRVILYDCEKESLEVRSRKEVDKGKLGRHLR